MKALFLGPEDVVDFVRQRLGTAWEIYPALDEASTDAVLPQVDAIIDAYMRVPFPASRLERAAKLRVVVTATTGANHIDDKHLASRNIPLLTLRGQREVLRNVTPAAEHSWLLLQACARDLRSAVDDVLAGGWDRNRHPGTMLRGRQLGLIGCGRIGEWMSRYAQAFGMKVVGYDPYVDPWPATVQRSELDPLLETSDFISLHVSLTDQNRGLLGPRQFQRIRPGAVLVNTSRGELIDEPSLLLALQEKRLAAAGLDVLCSEPNVADDPLLQYARSHSNLILTPHIGGFSPDALRYVLDFTCRRLLETIGGG